MSEMFVMIGEITVPTDKAKMQFCKVSNNRLVQVYSDSVISPEVEVAFKKQGYRIIHYKTKKCPWKNALLDISKSEEKTQ